MAVSDISLTGLLDGPAVDIYVGKKRKHFAVQKKLVCSRSTYFDKAFNGAFKEGIEGTIYFPDDSPDIVEAFIAWLYRGRLQQGPLDTKTQVQEAVTQYFHPYPFAEKYGIESLQNQAMNGLLDALSKHPSYFDLPAQSGLMVSVRPIHHSGDSPSVALHTKSREVIAR